MPNYCTAALISHTSKVMLTILQARVQQYMNGELPNVQAVSRKGRGTRDQIVNIQGFPGGSEVKASACNVGDLGSILGLGRSPGERHDNPPQYSCLENSMDRGAWRDTIRGSAKKSDMK